MNELSFFGILQDQFGDADLVGFVGHHGGVFLNGLCFCAKSGKIDAVLFKNIRRIRGGREN
jgi:hypothetical protein